MTDTDHATSGEVHRILDCTRRQLGRWLKRGVVVASQRTPGGQRRFTPSDLRRVRLVARMRAEGATRGDLARFVDAIHAEVEIIVAAERAKAASEVTRTIRGDHARPFVRTDSAGN